MNWQQLISNKRLGQEDLHVSRKDDRTEFKRDYDRLIFSAPFRRMQNKTQVFPLPGSIFVHNRLTHSLEVASVGRSLGDDVSRRLIKLHPELDGTLFCATDPKAGMSGSGNACGMFWASHRMRVRPSGSVSSGARFRVPSNGWQILMLTRGRFDGARISREAWTIGRVNSNSHPEAKAPCIRDFVVRSRVTTRRVSPTWIPGTAQVILRSSGS